MKQAQKTSLKTRQDTETLKVHVEGIKMLCLLNNITPWTLSDTCRAHWMVYPHVFTDYKNCLHCKNTSDKRQA